MMHIKIDNNNWRVGKKSMSVWENKNKWRKRESEKEEKNVYRYSKEKRNKEGGWKWVVGEL